MGTGYTFAATSASLTSATSGTFNITAGTPAKLVFTVQPSTTAAGAPIAPAVTVTVEDASGNQVTGATNAVTIAIGTNPGGATLGGTVTVNAVNGVATFSNLSLNVSSMGYMLAASSAGLTGATSGAFSVTAGLPGMLAFTVQPSTTAAGSSITPAVTVAVEDAGGNVVTMSNVAITLQLASNPGTTTLGGTTTVNAVNGIATFSNLSINTAATGYTLLATGSALTSTVSNAFNITAGTPVRLAFSVQPSTTAAGAPLAVTVAVEDVSGNLIPSATNPITIAIGTNPTNATLSGTATVNAVGGVATFTNLSLNLAGTGYGLTASSAGLSTGTSTLFNVTPGVPTKLAFVAQPTSTGAASTIAPPVTVALEDNSGNVVTSSSASVSLAIGTNPASGTLSGTTTVSAVNGIATFSTLSINAAGVGYTLTATSSSVTSAGSSPFNITAGAPGKLVFTVQPSNTAAGASIAPAVTVAIEDGSGNITSSTAAVTVDLANSIGGTLSGTTTVNAVNGIATFSNLNINYATSGYLLSATSAGVTATTSTSFNITPGTPTQLVFGTQPSTAVAGVSISPAVTVTIEDASGNPVTGATNAVTMAIGTNPGSGVLSGTTTVNAVNGVATFSTLNINQAGSGYRLAASSAGLSGASSGLFNITPGSASQLIFSVQPTNVGAGSSISPAVTVTVEDSSGNVVTSANNAIALSFAFNPSAGTLSGTTTINAVNGIATFSDLKVNLVGTGYTLLATSPTLSSATSTAFNVAPGAPHYLSFGVQPSTTAAGSIISPAVTVLVQDTQGNTVTSSTAAVTLTLYVNPVNGTLSGATTVNAVNGVATFSNLSINNASNSYELFAASSGLSGTISGGFRISPGTATKLAFTTQPSNATAGALISPAVVVTVEDSLGNTVTSATNTINLSFNTNPGGSSLGGTTSVNAVNGVATFPNLNLNKVGSSYALQATSGTLTAATSSTFNITPGTATQLVYTTQPVTTPPGATITPALTVAIEDASGNIVTSSTTSVSIAISSNPGSGTLSGTTTVSAVNGIATFSNLSINNPGNSYTLIASSAGLTSINSSAFNVTAGSPAQVAFVAQPNSVNAGSNLGSITVYIEDALGNRVTTSSASVSIAIGSNPGSGTLSGTTTASAVAGVATFPGLSINNPGTGYSLVASSSGLTPGTSNTFNVIGPAITLNLPSQLVGIGTTLNGSFTLATAAPVGGLLVTLGSSTTANVTISPATVTVTQGNTTGAFTYTGVANGPSTLSATAPGYSPASLIVTATSSLISLGAVPTITLGGTQSLALSLGTPAPSGGLTVNLTSDTPGVATVTSSVLIAAGATVPAANPQITGVSIGTANITATATSFAPNSRSVTVSTTAAITPTTISAYQTITTNATLTISGAAPAGGLTFTTSIDNTADATVPTSVTILAGSTSTQIPVTGVGVGSTTLRASYTGITQATATVNVAAPPAITVNSPIVGNNLYTSLSISVGTAPTSNQTMTVTSSDPTHFLLSTSSTSVGTASVTVNLTAGSTTVPTVYIQGQNYSGTTAITATVTASATGYTNGTGTPSLYPTGIGFTSSSFSTTTFSSPSALSIYLLILNPGTLTTYTYDVSVGPQASPISFTVTSGTPTVGTISGSPATIPVNLYYNNSSITFTPLTAGATTLTLNTPAGYYTPTSGAYSAQQITATVTSPGAISVGSPVVGNNLYGGLSLSLPVAPPTNRTMTVTSSDPTHFLLSTSSTSVGTASVTVNLTAGSTTVPTVYIQGQNYSGTTAITATVTASATGYTNGTGTPSLYPTGIGFTSSSFSTTTFSSPSALSIYLLILNPGTLTTYTYDVSVGPQASPISFTVTSGTPTVGTISGSPATIPVNLYYNNSSITFTPLTAGATTLTLNTPAGYYTPTSGAYSAQQITATVTSPGAISVGSPVVGNNLYGGLSLSLPVAPPTNRTMTVTSSDPTHFLLSTSSTSVGTASVTVNLTAGSTTVPTVYIQGQNYSGTTAITATVTASATGYTNGTGTPSLYPTGIGFTSSSFSTTTFSSPSALSIYLLILNPGTLTTYTYDVSVGPQASPISFTVTSGTPTVGTISGSPATIPVNLYYNNSSITFTPLTAGATTLTLNTPAGYYTPTSGAYSAQQITATVTAPAISVSSPIVGNNTYEALGLSLAAAPPSNETMTVTSSDPTHFLLSTSTTAVGTASVTVTLTKNSTTVPTVYIQGQNYSGTGAFTATITASAAGYNNGTGTETLYPTGIGFTSSSFSTTTFSSPSTLSIYLLILNPGSLTTYTYGVPLGPQASPISFSVVSGTTSVGTISGSPATIPVGSYYNNTSIAFTPLTAGATNLTLNTPAGYYTPTSGVYSAQQITATVAAPTITVGSQTVGNNTYTNISLSLAAPPPTNETMTITSSDPTHFLLSTSTTAVGSASVTVNLTAGSTTVPTVYEQGQNYSGSTAITSTITASAPGYATGMGSPVLYPTGIGFLTTSLSTSSTSSATSLNPYILTLNPASLTYYTYGYPLGPQAGPISFAVGSSNTGVGTITGSPTTIPVGSYLPTTNPKFQPLTDGASTITITEPTGFYTPTGTYTNQETATVTN